MIQTLDELLDTFEIAAMAGFTKTSPVLRDAIRHAVKRYGRRQYTAPNAEVCEMLEEEFLVSSPIEG